MLNAHEKGGPEIRHCIWSNGRRCARGQRLSPMQYVGPVLVGPRNIPRSALVRAERNSSTFRKNVEQVAISVHGDESVGAVRGGR